MQDAAAVREPKVCRQSRSRDSCQNLRNMVEFVLRVYGERVTVMKYKVLISGKNNPIIDDFFIQMSDAFEVLSTSTRFGDFTRHLKYFNPDAFIYCLYNESQDTLKQMTNIKQSLTPSRTPFILIGAKKDCDEFEKYAPEVANMTLVKPFTTSYLQEKIVKFLNERQRYQQAYNNDEEKEKEENLIEEISSSRSKKAGSDKESLKQMLSSLEEALTLADEINMETARKEDGEPASEVSEKPIVEAAAEEAETAPKRKHILIVDDDPIMLKMLKEHLHDDYDIATAINGKIAMKFLENKSTDLILLDYEMPGENGPAVLEKIREKKFLDGIPVVFLTGVSERGKIQEALALKPQSYLLKPIDRDKLLETISSILG